ncbi:hypothetical protein ACNOYE_29260 [Nannocystaceae bacterium ST9]
MIEGPIEAPTPAPAPAEALVPPVEALAPVEAAAPVEAPVEAGAPASDVDEEPAFVIAPGPVEPPATTPTPIAVEPDVMVIPTTVEVAPAAPAGPRPLQPWELPSRKPPWSGSGRFVGGAFMMVIGTGLLVAATLEYAQGRDATMPMMSNLPGGIGSVVAGGVMIGTGVRDQLRLSQWESATRRIAPPSGNGLIVAGVATTALGGLAAIATSIASDMDLDAPRSIPAGWATAGIGIGGGAAMLIAGIVRRAHYERAFATPTIAPTRGGASIGISGRF